MSGKGKIWKLLAKVLGVLLSAALLVLAAVSLILAKPEEQPPQPSAQPALSAAPALEIHSEEDLYRLVSDFPAPVMSFISGSGMTFVSALSSDAAAEYFDQTALMKLLDDHKSGAVRNQRKIWTAYTFLTWHKQFME